MNTSSDAKLPKTFHSASSTRIEMSLDTLQTAFFHHTDTIDSRINRMLDDQLAQKTALEHVLRQTFARTQTEHLLHYQEASRRLDLVSTQRADDRLMLSRVLETVTNINSRLETVSQVNLSQLPGLSPSNLTLAIATSSLSNNSYRSLLND